MSGAKRLTNAQVGALLAEVQSTMTTLSKHLPSEEQSKALGEIRTTQQQDHDTLIAMGTTLEFVKGAAERWDENHTVVSNLKQRVGLLSWGGGVLTVAAVAEGIRRIVDHFIP